MHKCTTWSALLGSRFFLSQTALRVGDFLTNPALTLNILNDKLGFGNLPGIDNGWNLDDALDYRSWACSAFGIHASAPPFPLFRIAYAINRFDASFEDPQANELVVSYQDNAVTNMGILHAAYGKVIVILHHRLGPNRCWIALGMK